jgi:general secretion pathway protein L
MNETTLGLDITTDMIRAVQVTGRGKGLCVSAFATVGFKEKGDIESSLKELFADDRFRSDSINSSITSGLLFYRDFKVPFAGEKRIRKVLPFELEPFLPLPIEQLLVDYLTVAGGDKTEVFAAAVEREKLGSYLETLKKYEIEPKIVDVEGVPLALYLIEKEESACGILLDIDRVRTTLVLWRDETIQMVRSIPFGADDITQTMTDAPVRQDPKEELTDPIDVTAPAKKAFERLSVMVENTMRAFSAQKGGFSPERIYLNGTGVMVHGAADILSSCFGIPAEHVDLKKNIPIRIDGQGSTEPWRPELMNNALALAVRAARKEKGFNFRQEEFQVQGSLVRYKNDIISIAAAVAVVLICIIANACTDYWLVKKKYHRLDSAVTQVFTDTLPDVKRIVNPVQQLKSRILEARSKKGILSDSAGGATLMDMLADLSRLMPEAADFKINSVVFDPDMIQFNGTTDNFNTVDSIKNGLQKSSYWKGVDISSAKLDSSGTSVEFKLILSKRENTT